MFKIKIPRKIKKAWKQCQADYPNIRYNTKWKRKAKRYAKGIMLIPEECINDIGINEWLKYIKQGCNLLYREKGTHPFAQPVYHYNPESILKIW